MTTASRHAPATSATSSRAVTRSPASGIRGMLAGWRRLDERAMASHRGVGGPDAAAGPVAYPRLKPKSAV